MGGADVAGSNFLPCMLVLPEDNHMVHCILTRPFLAGSFVSIVVKGELIRNGKIYDECGW